MQMGQSCCSSSSRQDSTPSAKKVALLVKTGMVANDVGGVGIGCGCSENRIL